MWAACRCGARGGMWARGGTQTRGGTRARDDMRVRGRGAARGRGWHADAGWHAGAGGMRVRQRGAAGGCGWHADAAARGSHSDRVHDGRPAFGPSACMDPAFGPNVGPAVAFSPHSPRVHDDSPAFGPSACAALAFAPSAGAPLAYGLHSDRVHTPVRIWTKCMLAAYICPECMTCRPAFAPNAGFGPTLGANANIPARVGCPCSPPACLPFARPRPPPPPPASRSACHFQEGGFSGQGRQLAAYDCRRVTLGIFRCACEGGAGERDERGWCADARRGAGRARCA